MTVKERSEMRKRIDGIIRSYADACSSVGHPMGGAESLTDRIVDLVRATDILTDGPVK